MAAVPSALQRRSAVKRVRSLIRALAGDRDLAAQLTAVSNQVAAVSDRIEEIAAAGALQGSRLELIADLVHALHDHEAEDRLRLQAVRRLPEYALAYDDPDPLVTIIIPTHDRPSTLGQRAIPSALAQTHRNVEVVVVGDASPREVAEVVASFGDPRIRYFNLSVRGPYSPDPRQAWLASGTATFNRGVSEARGRWFAPHADDDTFTPDHVERLLAAARRRRLEVAYGLLRQHYPDGAPERMIGEFPPRTDLGDLTAPFGLQAALIHSELRFMQMQLTDARLGLPNDFALIRRQVRAGVQMGMVDDVVGDYYPSQLWASP